MQELRGNLERHKSDFSQKNHKLLLDCQEFEDLEREKHYKSERTPHAESDLFYILIYYAILYWQRLIFFLKIKFLDNTVEEN